MNKLTSVRQVMLDLLPEIFTNLPPNLAMGPYHHDHRQRIRVNERTSYMYINIHNILTSNKIKNVKSIA